MWPCGFLRWSFVRTRFGLPSRSSIWCSCTRYEGCPHFEFRPGVDMNFQRRLPFQRRPVRVAISMVGWPGLRGSRGPMSSASGQYHRPPPLLSVRTMFFSTMSSVSETNVFWLLGSQRRTQSTESLWVMVSFVTEAPMALHSCATTNVHLCHHFTQAREEV